MDKNARAGYLMTSEQAFQFYSRCIEAEKAMGQKLTDEERDHLLQSMSLGQEMSLEEILDMMNGKKTLIIKDPNSESL